VSPTGRRPAWPAGAGSGGGQWMRADAGRVPTAAGEYGARS
jgi:hypothetical protein